MSAPAQTEPITPGGQVIFSRELPPDPDAAPAATAARQPPEPTLDPGRPDPLKVGDAEREAVTFTAYSLDAHLAPTSAGLSVRAVLTLRNDASQPLTRLILQISSSLHWDAFSIPVALPLQFTARRVATDADHTGYTQEAVVTLPQPLAPGASLPLTALYSGAIPASGERLERIGAPKDKALAADWDSIAPQMTALRGFGNVLWYPVAAAPVLLGDGARLFQAAGRMKLREEEATMRLRLAVEYTGDPPDAAFFCGHREQLTAHSDNPSLPAAEAAGIATAEFDARPLGFRTPSLFVTDHPASEVDPSGKAADVGLIAAVTDNYDTLAYYSAASALVQPLLSEWFGPHPQTSLTILDHDGEPFEDGALLVRPMRIEIPSALAPSLAHSLTHAWIRSTRPWIDEGLAQFAGLLWTEQTQGRTAALSRLQEDTRALALAEPAPDPGDPSATPAGESLLDAHDEVYYRAKAEAVWWMLRAYVGDKALQQALEDYRLDPKLDRQPNGFQHALEKTSDHDLRWFFDDWVYRDPGLPDLTIVSVTPRQLDARDGLPAGSLVAVQVRNDGGAETLVPVTVRSAAHPGLKASTETQWLRIPGQSSASIRIVFPGVPEEVQVNDGDIPETRVGIHLWKLTAPAQ